ncbi:MAG: outer membrane protein transport protein [Candidatus Alcyoniella australis]|nr:outer membrane protein transport protein [Candidatus Alcyoniella australis]
MASGFYQPDIGAKAVGRGAAMAVRADDLTCIWHNPAGLTKIKGTNLYVSSKFDMYKIWYQREPYGEFVTNRNPLDPIPFGALSTDFHLKHWTFAFGAYGPPGVTARYPEESLGGVSGTVETTTVAIYYTLAAGWQPLSWLRLGACGQLVSFGKNDHYSVSLLGDKLPAYNVIANFVAKDDWNPGYMAGILIQPLPWLEFGGSYLPDYNLVLSGFIEAELPEPYASFVGMDVYKDDISVEITFPQQVRFGVRFIPLPKWDLEFDAVWIEWSKVEGYPVDLDKEELLADFFMPCYWKDTWSLRTGTQYDYSKNFSMRCGYFFDQGAVPEETTGLGGPDTDKHGACGGFTINYWGFSLDFAYAHLFMAEREVAKVLPGNSLGDGRGYYKNAYDYMEIGFNINFEDVYHVFHGK